MCLPQGSRIIYVSIREAKNSLSGFFFSLYLWDLFYCLALAINQVTVAFFFFSFAENVLVVIKVWRPMNHNSFFLKYCGDCQDLIYRNWYREWHTSWGPALLGMSIFAKGLLRSQLDILKKEHFPSALWALRILILQVPWWTWVFSQLGKPAST